MLTVYLWFSKGLIRIEPCFVGTANSPCRGGSFHADLSLRRRACRRHSEWGPARRGAMDRGNRAAAARVRGSSFMRTIQMCAAAAVVCLAGVSLAGEKWDSKDPSQWSSTEIDKLLHDSPWAQKAKVQLGQTMGGNGQGPNSGGGNYPNGGGGYPGGGGRGGYGVPGIGFPFPGGGGMGYPGAGVEAGAAAIAVRRHLMSTPPCAGRVRCRCAWPMRNRIRRRSRRRRLR